MNPLTAADTSVIAVFNDFSKTGVQKPADFHYTQPKLRINTYIFYISNGFF